MLKSYFKIAFRNLWKHKLFSFINIFGLAAGMAVSILALIDLKSAYDYDRFHPFPERTCRIITDIRGKNNNSESWGSSPGAVAGHIKKYSFTEECVQVFPYRLDLLSGNDKLNLEVNFVDPGFFRVFGFKMLRGHIDTTPYKMVLSVKTANRFFGKGDPVGKTLKQKDGAEYTVTGILAEPDGKSHIGYNALVSSSTVALLDDLKAELNNQLNPVSCYTYVLLKKGTPETVLNQVLPGIGKQATAAIPAESGLSAIHFRWQPLEAITPDKEDLLRTTSGGGGGPEFTKILVQIGVGILTLLLAGFNYVNLTLAKSFTRAREVGVRKVIGARRGQIMLQFIMESVIISAFALLLSIWMIQCMKPLNVVAQILEEVKWDLQLWTILLAFSLLAGVLAGIIPAILLTAFSPVTALKAKNLPMVFRGLTLRKVLVVLQFSISLTGIIFMLVMFQQQKFMAEGKYGFNRDHILNIDIADQDYRRIQSVLIQQPGVEMVSATSGLLGLSYPSLVKARSADKQYTIQAGVQSADAGFFGVMGLQLLAGENIPVSVSDSSGTAVLLNEEAFRQLHFGEPAKAVGQLIWLNDSTRVRVAGVVKDFHYLSMAHPIMPLMIRYEPANFRVLQVKVASPVSKANIKEALAARLSNLISPRNQNLNWFDEQFYEHHFHANDQLFVGVLTAMVLSIACLGLLGMVTYTSETRTKEVGIRKVMGASVSQVVMLLSRDFVWLLGIAALVAFPAGIISGVAFLNNFAYHIFIGSGTVLTAFFALVVIGGLTIGWQAFRTARANPVETLRTE